MEARIPLATDWSAVSQFLATNLRQEVQWTLEREYPLAFADDNRNNVRIITEGDKVLAHAVMKPHLIKSNYHLFKVGLIGSVVTEKDHRGKGLSTEIVNSCLKACEDQACDIAILWTDLFNFYSKFGFEIGGNEIALQIDQNFKGHGKSQLRILESAAVDPQALLNLYNRHSLRTIRHVDDVRKYLQIPQSRVFTAWSQITGGLEAYAVMGKGADFTHYIHEWGGSVSSLKALLEHIVQTSGHKITLITPPQCANLIEQLEKAGADKFFGILGMIKIINPESFCKKIKKGTRALGYQDFVFDYREGRFFFGFLDEIYQTDSSADIVRLVFGPATPGQIHNFNEKTLQAFSEAFPIPFWVWGWDSI